MGADDRRTYEEVKYQFSADERQDVAQQLARECQHAFELEAQRKAMMAELGGQIKAAENRVAELSVLVNNGYEMRSVEVLHIMDEPLPGTKRVVRVDTGELLREEKMSFAELQRGFPFEV
jgi:hypothetical protein